MKKYMILLIILVNLMSAEAAILNDSRYYTIIEFGTGLSNVGNDNENISIMIGGQLPTYNETNNVKLEQGLFKTSYIITEESEEDETDEDTSGGPGGPGPKTTTEYYDVIVDTVHSIYYITETVEADILIINKGKKPDRDTIFSYYLVNQKKEYMRSTEYFEAVEIGETELTRRIALPLDAEVGEWHFCVDYETTVQPLITACDAFQVSDVYNIVLIRRYMWLIKLFSITLFILLIMLFFLLAYKRSKKKMEGG